MMYNEYNENETNRAQDPQTERTNAAETPSAVNPDSAPQNPQTVSEPAAASQPQSAQPAQPQNAAPVSPASDAAPQTARPAANPQPAQAPPAYGQYGYQNPYNHGTQNDRGFYGQQPYQNPSAASHTYTSYNRAPVQNTKKKTRTGITRAAAAVLCICTILLSCAAGFFGAHMATRNVATPSTTVEQPVQNSSGGTSVIYRAPESSASGMSSSGGRTDYYTVASKVKDAVVEITTESVVSSYFQYITAGAGSGVILTEDGYIVTNNHVIADTDSKNNKIADSITVRLTNGEEYPAKVIGTDADSDIAVIKIDVTGLPSVTVGNSDKLAVGEEVIAVGNPLGELGGTVTNGIISALDREVNVDGERMNLMQTNAAINPGNSGGGLFNMSGELIGIVNAKSSGTGIEGLGFAIPVNDAIDVAEQLIAQGYVSGKPTLGVTFYDVTSYNQALYLRVTSLGVYVYSLEEGYNDQVFRVGDRVIAVDGQEISSFSDIKAILKKHSVGDTLTFSVYRSGKLTEVTATCYEYTPDIVFDN